MPRTRWTGTVGRRGVRARARRGEAAPRLGRLQLVPLVPRDGARVVRGRRHAALMNDLFVNVKVDREERPDVDAVTMEATVGMTGTGGWPTTVFMTPEGKPFYAGTYFPPEPRHGLASFRDLLRAVAAHGASGESTSSARQADRRDAARSAGAPPSTEPLTESILGEARGIARRSSPRSAASAVRRSSRPPRRSSSCSAAGTRRAGDGHATLDGMAAGGMYDVVGGGFHRYSVDERWLVPHFEKMLYDNAVLASTYLHGWVVTGRRGTGRSSRRRSTISCGSCCFPRAVRVRPGRRHRRRRGADVHLVRGRSSAAGIPRSCSSRSSTVAWSCAVSSSRSSGACAGRARAGRSRSGTTRCSPPGTGSPSPLSPRRRTGSSARTGSTAARALGEFLLGPLADDGRLLRSSRRAGERQRLPRRLRERRVRAHGAARRDR